MSSASDCRAEAAAFSGDSAHGAIGSSPGSGKVCTPGIQLYLNHCCQLAWDSSGGIMPLDLGPWTLRHRETSWASPIQMAMRQPGLALENLKSACMAGSWPCRIHQNPTGQSCRLLPCAPGQPGGCGRDPGNLENRSCWRRKHLDAAVEEFSG